MTTNPVSPDHGAGDAASKTAATQPVRRAPVEDTAGVNEPAKPTADTYFEEQPVDDFQMYRAVSKPAVISCILAALSFTALWAPQLLFVPVIGVVLGIIGVISIRRYPTELTGVKAAYAGIIAGLLIIVSSVSIHTIIYLTEVPEGYDRISFGQLNAPPGSDENAPPPPGAYELNGKKVFIKGYLHPGVSGQGNVRQFVLVGDLGTCCFGGQPELTHMIDVTIEKDKDPVSYNTHRRNLTGTLYVSRVPLRSPGVEKGGFYRLVADSVQ